ncbi:MAG: beta-lactamase family protein [Defluviitaleaceae bacterium]|nr:beta-lactamase family protein [Defluviitaleaceae bacterium]
MKNKKFMAVLFAIIAVLGFGLLFNLRPETILSLYNFRGTVLIEQNGETVLRAARGMACDAQNIEHTVYSSFHVASITKQITGAAILLLELDGKLNTSDTLDNFFEGHEYLSEVTVAHLLAMKGGFRSFTQWLMGLLDDEEEFEKILSLTYADIEDFIFVNWLGAPQTQPIYCNSDYWLLGRIIEQVSGTTYAEFVTSRIFEPIGMANSGFHGIHTSTAPHGNPDIYFRGINMVDAHNWPPSIPYSTGGIISTIDDLNLWLDAYFGGKLFPVYLLDDIVLAGNYNYGWSFTSDPVWMHPGEMFGFNTHILYDRASSTRIIILSNQRRGAPIGMVRALSLLTLGGLYGGLHWAPGLGM